MTAALVTMRVYWPSEPDTRDGAGGGLFWALGMLAAAIVALASGFVSGRPRPRWSWADAAVFALVALVGVSAQHAADLRAAYNLAWSWVGVGLAYFLVRNLPRTRAESSALAGLLVASAVAVAVYGLYQVTVELPAIREEYVHHKDQVLRMLDIAPGSAQQAAFESRVLGSNEPWSTFGLANSLAGYIVGPLVAGLAVWWQNLTGRRGEAGRRPSGLALALAAPWVLLLLGCLVLTKSRSAYAGFAAALVVLAWSERRRVRGRTLALAALVGVVVVGGLVAAAWATKRFDRLVLTQSFKSLQYRWEYWVGTWRLIMHHPGVFWRGLGPGNFGWAYVRYKLPQSSEEIADPHDMFLDVWATAGVGALLALAAALAFGLWNTLGPPRESGQPPGDGGAQPDAAGPREARPPARPTWLITSAALGLGFVMFWSQVVLFETDVFVRWVVIAVAWGLPLLCGQALWARQPVPASALGAGALAVAVNLTAAGGIGITAVALMLWSLFALGLNLRVDRRCGVPRDVDGRVASFALAACWAALMGLFFGTVRPYWVAESFIAEAESALRAKPPRYDKARSALTAACESDRYYARPWLMLAGVELSAWKERGALVNDKMYRAVPIAMYKAVARPRNPNVWSLQRDCAVMDREVLSLLKGSIPPAEEIRIRGDAVRSSRQATLLYPTNPNLHALLAETSADIGKLDDAVTAAEAALRLDKLTPHKEKKLPDPVRDRLMRQLPVWRKGVPGDG
jgi:O-antigen ligase